MRDQMGPTLPTAKSPFFSSLRVRLLLLVVSALAPAMMLILYMAANQYEAARMQVQAAAQRLVRIAAADHARQFSAARQTLLALAEMVEVRDADTNACASGVSKLLTPATGFVDLRLIDSTGKSLCTWPEDTHAVTAAEAAVARKAIDAGHFVVGGHEFDSGGGRTEVHFAYQRPPADGQAAAALVLSYDLSRVGNLIRSGGLPDGSVIAILDEGGTVLYRSPDPQEWVGKRMADSPLARSMLGTEREGVIETEGFDGVPRLFAYSPLRVESAGQTIYLHTGIPTALAYQEVRHALRVSLGGLCIASLIVVTLAWFGGNRLVARPIASLIAAIQRLRSGQFGVRSGLEHSVGEFGQLADAFDGMAEALKQRQFEAEQIKNAIDEHAIVSIAGLDGKITFVNDKFVEVSRYSRAELLGQDHRILNSGHHDKAFFAQMWRTIASGAPWHGVIRNRRKDGSYYWVATTIVPMIDTDMRQHQYLSIRTEVTQIKQMEESLRQREVLFRGLTENMSSAVIVHRGSKLLFANRYAEVMTGFTRTELMDLQLEELVHEQSRALVKSRAEARLCGKPVTSRYEFRLETKDGRECWVEVTAGSIDFKGQPAVIATFMDITERRSAQQILRDAHGELERLVEQRTAQLMRAKQDLEYDVTRRAKAEAELIERNSELVTLNQQLSAAQSQLTQSEKLASIGQLAAGIAHEINNPIGYVQSNLGSLGKALDDLLAVVDAYEAAEAAMGDSAALRDVRRIKQDLDLGYLREDLPNLMAESNEGITRVRKIVQDLKDFSRVDTIREWEFADLHRCLDSTLNIVSNEIKYRADVIKDYGALPEVECLPSELNQVFMNLLLNAAQAITAERGQIVIRTGTDDEGQHAWVEVADNGCGIAQEHLTRIFDPFFTTKPVGKGTGLGLSLSYGIVKKHHGQLEAHSEPGRGTMFRVTMPVRRLVEVEA